MSYFQNLISSFFNPHVYLSFIRAKSSKAFAHFALSLVLIGAAQGFYFVYKLFPMLRERLTVSADEIVADYPADLLFHWDGQSLTTEPDTYDQLVMRPSDLPLFAELAGQDEVIVYRDAELTASEAAAVLGENQVGLVVDRQAMYYLSQESGMEIAPLSDHLDENSLTINKNVITMARDWLFSAMPVAEKFVWWLAPLLVIAGLLVSRLVTALIFATILLLPARLGKVITTWRESWRFTLVLLVVVEIVSLAVSLLYPGLTFPVYSVAFWALSAFILLALNAEQPEVSNVKKSS